MYLVISLAPLKEGSIGRVKVKGNTTAHSCHVDDAACMSVPIGGTHEKRSRQASGGRTGLWLVYDLRDYRTMLSGTWLREMSR